MNEARQLPRGEAFVIRKGRKQRIRINALDPDELKSAPELLPRETQPLLPAPTTVPVQAPPETEEGDDLKPIA